MSPPAMLSVLALALQPLAVTAATGAASTECTVRAPPQLRKASPLSFGMNDVLGTIINLTYSDPALVKSVKTLNVGALRHPGGTVANYWTMANGSYVGADGTSSDGGCSNPPHWNYCNFQQRIDQHPPRTFSAAAFAKGVGSEVGATVHDLNVFAMSTAQSIAELESLASSGVVITHLELGNELYTTKNYGWHFPTAQDYAAACVPVVAAAKRLFPRVRIAVVGHTGGVWNGNLSTQAALLGAVDAVTMHHYGPPPDTVGRFPPASQRSFIVASGEIDSAQMAATARQYYPGLSLWRTEYNYPGSWVGALPAVYAPTGGVHALFMAGHVLAALQHERWDVPFEVLMMHCLVHQPSAGWTSSNATLLIVGDGPNDVSAVQVGAVAQVYTHLTHAALKQHGWVGTPSLSDGCPSSRLVAAHANNFSCLQTAVFGDSATALSGTGSLTFVVMNRCEQPVTATLQVPSVPAATARPLTVDATTYLGDDEGGWAALEGVPAAPPWSAPLSPVRSGVCEGGQAATCRLPPVSLTLATVSL
jgi:hypothetical protein